MSVNCAQKVSSGIDVILENILKSLKFVLIHKVLYFWIFVVARRDHLISSKHDHVVGEVVVEISEDALQ